MQQSIFNMFGRSPIHPLQVHMEKVQACVELLVPFFQSVMQADWESAKQHQKAISKLESKADEDKKDIRLHLPKNLFLPVSRADLLLLLSMQDRVANKAKDIAGLILGRKMQFPERFHDQMLIYLQRNVDACQQALIAIEKLDELLETSFRGRSVHDVAGIIDTLDKIERDTDRLQRKLRAALFEIEKELPPIDVVFIYHIIDNIGELADRAQAVGGQLQLILAR